MTKITLMTNQNLLRLWKFFKWVDNARWNGEHKERGIEELLKYTNKMWEKYKNEEIDDFESKHLVLSHWLMYIFDYQMPVERVWEKCFPIMTRIVKEFQEGLSADEVIKKYYNDEEGHFSIEKNVDNKDKFKHRFMKAKNHRLVEKVERTLKILEKSFNKDLIEFMLTVTSYGNEENWVRKVATGLYLLTYDNEYSDVDEIIDVLNNEEKFERYFSRKKNNLWHKRLWSALRDYLKGFIYESYILSSLENYKHHSSKVLSRWRNANKYLNQLEVPGDVWNEKFYERVMKPIIEKLDKKYSKYPPKGIREIYKDYNKIFKQHKFYPEQFDVTFDFARIFCDKNLCYICPLHNNKNILKLCISDIVSESDKYCPILAMLGYLQKCSPDNCPIYRGESLNLCMSEKLAAY